MPVRIATSLLASCPKFSMEDGRTIFLWLAVHVSHGARTLSPGSSAARQASCQA